MDVKLVVQYLLREVYFKLLWKELQTLRPKQIKNNPPDARLNEEHMTLLGV